MSGINSNQPKRRSTGITGAVNRTTITLDGHEAQVDASIINSVIPVLEHSVRRFHAGGPLGMRHQMEVVKHYRLAEDGCVKFSRGLISRVRRHLEGQGYVVSLRGETNGLSVSDVDPHLIKNRGLSAEDGRFLESLLVNPLNRQVHVRNASDIGHRVALFAQFASDLNIYVVACNKHRVRQLVSAISQGTDRPVTSDSRATWSHHPRIFVGTVKLFQHSMSAGFNVAIFTDFESVLASCQAHDSAVKGRWCTLPDSPKNLSDFKQFRLDQVWADGTWYAFIEVPRGLSDYEHFVLEEICGPVIYAPREDQRLAKVNVRFEPALCARHTGTKCGLQRKRELYWHSTSWNEMVATTVAGLRKKRCRQTISILVESTEHGMELLKQLPGWELLTDNTPTTCIPLVANRQIATFAYAQRWGIGTDVIIRADGGAGWPLLAGFPRFAQREDDAVLLIDFDDRVDGTAIRTLKSRRIAYRQFGWNVIDAAEGEITFRGRRTHCPG